jgi:LysM repeat protein
MKPHLLFATLSLVLASPVAFGKSELETLRLRCSEQERQIRLLEEENSKLRTNGHEAQAALARRASAPPAASTTEASPTDSSSAHYTVKAGDNWEKIARKVGSDSKTLAKANGLKITSVIHPGQKLKVPGVPVEAASSTSTATLSAPSAGSYKVQPGDTFSSISKKHGVSTKALLAANPRIKPSTLQPGQVVSLGSKSIGTTMIAAAKAPSATGRSLPTNQTPMTHRNIPVSTAEPFAKPAPTPKPAPSAKPASTPKPAPAPKPASTPRPSSATPAVESAPAPAAANQPTAESESPSPRENKIHAVTINGEMTYGEFASQHGTDTDRLNALNGLDLTTTTVLAKGSELYVPAQP